MEHELINRYRFNEDTLRRSYGQIMRPVLVIQLLIALALLGAAIYYTVSFFSLFTESLSLLLMVLLLYVLAGFEAWRALTAVKRAARKAIRHVEQTKQVSEYEVTLRFGDEEIVTESSLGGEPRELKYATFKKLKRAKDLILLRTRSTLVYTLDPACFENGTEDDFWRLMNEKCPAAVPKQYRA